MALITCEKCGHQSDDSTAVCGECGIPINQAGQNADDENYIGLVEGVEFGPIDLAGVQSLLAEGKIDLNTPYAAPGMTSWQPVKRLNVSAVAGERGQEVSSASALVRSPSGNIMNYYIINDTAETKGPYTIGQLRSMWGTGAITANTSHCIEGAATWTPLADIIDQLEPQTPAVVPSTIAPTATTPSSPSTPSTPSNPVRSRGIYIILALLFGMLWIHDFYAGRYREGAGILFCTCILGWIVIGLIMSFVIILAEVFSVTTDGDGQPFTS